MFSQVMGYPAYKLNLSQDLLGAADPAALLTPLHQGKTFAYAKVEVTDWTACRFLSQQGFALVDTSTTFDKAIQSGQQVTGNSSLRFADLDDQNSTVRVARTSFRFSRFHQDPLFPPALADEIKAAWAGNYFRGQRGQAMVLAFINGQLAGFLQLLYKANPDGGQDMVIDLIAVDENYRRRSVARDLIVYAESECPPDQNVYVSTQLANIPSMRLYEGLGFRMHSAQHVYHFHHA
jgi:ribosomal protein S18 acetylase RimI-like enzyme